MELSKPLGLATILVIASAALHLITPLIGDGSMALAVLAILYGPFALGLRRNMRWIAWLAFFCMLFGGAVAVSGIIGASGVSAWLFTLILIANTGATIALFAYLWKPKPLASA